MQRYSKARPSKHAVVRRLFDVDFLTVGTGTDIGDEPRMLTEWARGAFSVEVESLYPRSSIDDFAKAKSEKVEKVSNPFLV